MLLHTQVLDGTHTDPFDENNLNTIFYCLAISMFDLIKCEKERDYFFKSYAALFRTTQSKSKKVSGNAE